MKKILPAAAAATALALTLWLWPKAGKADSEGPEPEARVQVAPLAKEPISQTLEAFGTVEPAPNGVYLVAAAYDCVVREVAAGPGARVGAGDALFEVEPAPDVQLELATARGAAAQADRSLLAARQRYELRLATTDDLQASEQANRDAHLKLANLEQRGLGEAPARLLSRFAGIVVKVDAQPGATVPAGTALAAVAIAGRLQARLGIEASDAGLVKVGQSLTLEALGRPDTPPRAGTVASKAALADPASSTIDVRVALGDGDWMPGEHVAAAIELARRTALVAPRSAVLSQDGQDVLYTVKADKAVRHAVTVGVSSGDKVEVAAEGLAPGDSVVVQGNYELSDGMSVVVGAAEAGAGPGGKTKGRP